MALNTNKKMALVFISFGIIGIGYYLYSQSKKLMNFCLSFKGAKINKISPTLVDISAIMGFENKSNLDVTVSNQDYQVLINGVLVTTIKSDKPILLTPKQISNLPLRISFNPMELKGKAIGLVKELVSNQNAIKITFKGSLGVKSGILALAKFPIDITYTLKELMTPKTNSECK